MPQQTTTQKIYNIYGEELHSFEVPADVADSLRWMIIEAVKQGKSLSGANLSRADLSGADLSRADLYGANLSLANLSRADLYGANLSGAEGAELTIAKTRILPEGDILGYKKCKDNVIVKLCIPADAKRSHAFGRKCRAEYAKVLEVFGAEYGIAIHDGQTTYVPGEFVYPDSFSEDWQTECAPGIHFFITRIEAENYRC